MEEEIDNKPTNLVYRANTYVSLKMDFHVLFIVIRVTVYGKILFQRFMKNF